MIATAFVDYDNFRHRIPEKNQWDVEHNLGAIIRPLLEEVKYAGGIKEVDIRLYGGWIDEDASSTKIASWLIGSAQRSRGRWQGLIVRPSLIKTTIWQPDHILSGTYRSRAVPPRQKMVDGMIMMDLLFFAQNDPSRLFVLSDDDDLLPGIMAAAGLRDDSVSWIRLCSVGDRPNDPICELLKIKISKFRGAK